MGVLCLFVHTIMIALALFYLALRLVHKDHVILSTNQIQKIKPYATCSLAQLSADRWWSFT